MRTNVLPFYKPFSISKVLRDYNFSIGNDLRFYVGGSTTNTAGYAAYVDAWNQNFIAYDKETGQICDDINAIFQEQLAIQYQNRPFSYLPDTINWNSVLTLNLNQIEKTKVLVYYVYCSSYLMNAFPDGFFMISYYGDKTETLLFQNTIFADSWKSHYAICFIFEYIDDEWKIIPMRKYFAHQEEMENALNLRKPNELLYSYQSSDEDISGIKLEDI